MKERIVAVIVMMYVQQEHVEMMQPPAQTLEVPVQARNAEQETATAQDRVNFKPTAKMISATAQQVVGHVLDKHQHES